MYSDFKRISLARTRDCVLLKFRFQSFFKTFKFGVKLLFERENISKNKMYLSAHMYEYNIVTYNNNSWIFIVVYDQLYIFLLDFQIK